MTYGVDTLTEERFQAYREGKDPIEYFRVQPESFRIKLPKNSIDLVTLNMSLCHLSDKSNVLREIRRVLRHGGYLFLKEHDVPADDTELRQKLDTEKESQPLEPRMSNLNISYTSRKEL